MSTRCQIGFYQDKDQTLATPDVLIYKHQDGYPEGVLPILEPFCKDFAKGRGLGDTEYAGAWFVHALIAEHIRMSIEMKKEHGYSSIPADGRDFLSHGICKVVHTDIDYYYRVHPNQIEIYQHAWEGTKCGFPIPVGLVQTIDLFPEDK